MEVCCRRSSKKSTAGVRFGTAGVLAETAATTNPHNLTFLRVDMIGRRDQSKVDNENQSKPQDSKVTANQEAVQIKSQSEPGTRTRWRGRQS